MKRLLPLLLLLGLALAQIDEPKLVSEITTTLDQGGSISVRGGTMYSFALNVTIPQDTSYQDVEMDADTVLDSEGNRLAVVSADKPVMPFEYGLDSAITTRERTTTFLNSSYLVPDDFVGYVQSSETVQSDHPAMKSMAEWITANSSSDFVRIAKLATWVHDHVTYDLSLVGQRKDAVWVLENKRGVCVEYSSLFAALARSMGYPTRFVLGQAYGDYGWLGHAWNEVYVGGEWVPVDATWLEAGHLDAAHIEFFKSIESQAANRIVAHVSNDASIEWQKPEFAGESNGSAIEIGAIESSPERSDFDFSISSQSLGFGEAALVTLGIRGKDYRVIDARLLQCKSDTELLSIDGPTRAIIVEPGKMTYTSWPVTVSPNLDAGIVYTCPITVNSHYLDEKTVSLVMKKASTANGFTAFLSDSAVGEGESVSLFVNARQGEKITVTSDDHYESRLAGFGNTEFTLTASSPGTHSIYVATESGGVQRFDYSVASGVPEVFIKSVTPPKAIFEGGSADFTVVIENTNPSPEPVNVRVAFEGVEHMSRQVITGVTDVTFTAEADSAGEKVLEIEITGDGFSDTESVPFMVYQQPGITIGEHSLSPFNSKVVVQIPIERTDSVTEVRASMAGQSSLVNESPASFLVDPDLYTLTVEWVDINGVQHKDVKVINAVLAERADVFGKSYFVLAIVAALALFALVYGASRVIGEVKKGKGAGLSP